MGRQTACHPPPPPTPTPNQQCMPIRHIADNLSTGNAMHYGQRRYEGSLGDAVLEALQLLERTGGPDAFLNIKYIVPGGCWQLGRMGHTWMPKDG